MTPSPELLALDLLRTQRVLVLATSDPDPWPAPVYFVRVDGALAFFSSPRSRHARAAGSGRPCAGSVHRDADDWRDIEGLQMEGTVAEVGAGPGADRAVRAYVERFPAVREILGQPAPGLARFEEVLGAHLFAFTPVRTWYVNNRAGLAGRREIRLPPDAPHP
ncbi:MAG TPA: pyridoxamine 5'-phosphate oxidase family protein [Anaeromyxobacteraceae bacterium]|nr:pyridoxamine 5'-phosphate oxidase family protein [Anaeromyxobacteraceae bacterium]